MPNYRRYDIPGHSVFLTIVTYGRRPWLTDDACVETVLESMRWAKSGYPFRHIAHVILPDHLHWILEPASGTRCSDLVGAMKRDATWGLDEAGLTGPFWQKRLE